MVTHYSSHKKEEPGLSRTIFRLAIVFVLVFVMVQAYPYLKGRWTQWSGGDTTESVVEQVRERVDSGDLAAAASVLDAALAEEQDPAVRKSMLIQGIELAQQAESWPDVSRLSEQLLRGFPSDPQRPRHIAIYGQALERQERYRDARTQYEGILTSAPSGMRSPALLGLGRIAEQDEKSIDARELYEKAFEDAEIDSLEWNEALDAMGRLNVDLAFSQMETPESKYYTITSGDNLTDIGIKLNTTQGLLIRANGISDPGKLHLGQRLKYTPKDFRILIERSTCRIFLMDSQGPFKRYYTGLGMPGHETTIGSYTVGSKQKDPTWFPKNRPAVQPGDPANELGSRWIPMVPAEEGLPSDLGMHGTIVPESIGKYESHGCPRMLNDQVEELYDLVVRSTPVDVVETISWAPATGDS
jgi:tetratricopeptide (TPR) repeat protein